MTVVTSAGSGANLCGSAPPVGTVSGTACRRVGIYGGSFDPIHRGHLSVARAVHKACALDAVVFVPAQQSPHKQAPAASAADRVEMVQIALSGIAWASVSTWEVDRSPPSYTVETVRAVSDAHSDAELFLVVGADVLAEFSEWRDPEGILQRASIVAVGRPGVPLEIPASLEGLARAYPGRVLLCPGSTPAISSQGIRAMIRRGEAPDAHVAVGVARYIDRHQLYR